MKSYDETISNVFDRIGEYERNQKRKRSTIIKSAVSFCCVCAIALVGVGVLKGNHTPENYVDDAVIPGIQDTVDDLGNDETPDNNNSNNNNSDVIIFNEISEISVKVPSEMGIAVFRGDEVPMTKDELNEYYGVNVFPTLPDGFEETPKWLGIYRRDKGTGDVYYDTNQLQYTNPEGSKTIVVSIEGMCYLTESPDGNKSAFAELYVRDIKESVISGVKVILAETKSEKNFYAEFMYEGVQFGIWSENVTQDEFIEVIYSMISE